MLGKILNRKMIGILAVSLVLFGAIGMAEEGFPDAGGQWTYVLEDGGATIRGYAKENGIPYELMPAMTVETADELLIKQIMTIPL